jgi:ferritin-like metal-binding protein YciE
MPEKDLSALFLDTMKDIYYAEKQIYKSLPKLAKAATSAKLRAAFEKHRDETEGQIERLEKIFELMGKPARGKKCDAIEGIIDEGKEIMQEDKGEPALDAGLLAAAQAVEHYLALRHAAYLGGPAEYARCSQTARPDAGRGKEDGRDLEPARHCRRQRGSGLSGSRRILEEAKGPLEAGLFFGRTVSAAAHL